MKQCDEYQTAQGGTEVRELSGKVNIAILRNSGPIRVMLLAGSLLPLTLVKRIGGVKSAYRAIPRLPNYAPARYNIYPSWFVVVRSAIEID